jgi:hypothetical protein
MCGTIPYNTTECKEQDEKNIIYNTKFVIRTIYQEVKE